MNSYDPLKDGNIISFFQAENTAIGKELQIDFGVSKIVRSFYMTHVNYNNVLWKASAEYDVYVGDTPYTDATYASKNTKCFTGGQEGLANCQA